MNFSFQVMLVLLSFQPMDRDHLSNLMIEFWAKILSIDRSYSQYNSPKILAKTNSSLERYFICQKTLVYDCQAKYGQFHNNLIFWHRKVCFGWNFWTMVLTVRPIYRQNLCSKFDHQSLMGSLYPFVENSAKRA
jgi:hypothetical protein